jgi:Rrf2 family protein
VGVVKISLRGEYALRALVVLGSAYDQRDAVVRIQTISEQQNIPKRFLEQILNDLRSGGILESRRGVSGGYRLRKSPEQITLAEVIRRIEGPLAPVRCVSERFYKPCTCPDEARCGVRSVMKDVRDAIVKILENVTVAELCQRVRQLQRDAPDAHDYTI